MLTPSQLATLRRPNGATIIGQHADEREVVREAVLGNVIAEILAADGWRVRVNDSDSRRFTVRLSADGTPEAMSRPILDAVVRETATLALAAATPGPARLAATRTLIDRRERGHGAYVALLVDAVVQYLPYLTDAEAAAYTAANAPKARERDYGAEAEARRQREAEHRAYLAAVVERWLAASYGAADGDRVLLGDVWAAWQDTVRRGGASAEASGLHRLGRSTFYTLLRESAVGTVVSLGARRYAFRPSLSRSIAYLMNDGRKALALAIHRQRMKGQGRWPTGADAFELLGQE